ncbi:MAG: SAM-dependent methyltransferase [Pseudomonadota bacterium]
MHAFPMFIKTTGRRVVIVGGGEQAAQKARLILKTDAQIVLAAPALDPELSALVETGRAEQHRGAIDVSLFDDAAMAFIATGCIGIDASIHAIARAARCAVNVVDQPDLCEVTTPAIVDRDPVVIAIGTEGAAPVLARQIKTKLEEDLPQSLGGLAALAGRLRGAVARHVARPQRRDFWRWVFAETPRQLWEKGAEHHASQAIKRAISSGGAPKGTDKGAIAVVGAGPGARDLLTLRAVQRLQEADVIFYDGKAGEDALELARRDAERIYVGPVPGAHAWPRQAIRARILAEARRGCRVVTLSTGDATETASAFALEDEARADGLSVEIVPGIVTLSCQSRASSSSVAATGAAGGEDYWQEAKSG